MSHEVQLFSRYVVPPFACSGMCAHSHTHAHTSTLVTCGGNGELTEVHACMGTVFAAGAPSKLSRSELALALLQHGCRFLAGVVRALLVMLCWAFVLPTVIMWTLRLYLLRSLSDLRSVTGPLTPTYTLSPRGVMWCRWWSVVVFKFGPGAGEIADGLVAMLVRLFPPHRMV